MRKSEITYASTLSLFSPEIDREWFRAKVDIECNHKGQTFLQLWSRFSMKKGSTYPKLLHLIRIFLVFPVSTSQVERQFSIVKRLALKPAYVHHCAPADYQSQEAVARW